MKTVWKYRLQPHDVTDVLMPIQARVLTAQLQGDDVCLWALVDAEESQSKVHRRFVVLFTGEPYKSDIRYIATLQDGAYVLHVFEVV